MEFTTGDAIVHPVRGAGVIECIVERLWRGKTELFYRIKLLGQSGTMLMIPASAAKELGMRGAISQSDEGQLWRVLLAAPRDLPSDHKQLLQCIEDKLGTGDIFQVAEAVRDMAWRKRNSYLNATIKKLYEEGIRLLVGEIAATQGIAFVNAETQFSARLKAGLSSRATTQLSENLS